MIDVPLDEDAAKQLALIDQAARAQIDRDLGALERIVDLGDQVAARIATMQASLDPSSDPTL